MTGQEKPKPLLSGIIYGEIAFWITIVGMLVATIGIIMYFFGRNQLFACQELLNGILEGKNAVTICDEIACKEIEYGNWYLSNLSFSDSICMLGMGICGLAAIVGVFGYSAGVIVKREKPYIFLVFALIIAVILVLSATGLISIR